MKETTLSNLKAKCVYAIADDLKIARDAYVQFGAACDCTDEGYKMTMFSRWLEEQAHVNGMCEAYEKTFDEVLPNLYILTYDAFKESLDQLLKKAVDLECPF